MHERNGNDGRVRVLIADEHRPARVGALVALKMRGFDVVDECATAAAAIAKARARRPDVCIVDAGLPGGGLAAAGAIAALRPAPRVVVLGSSESVDEAVAALDAGASGYLLKNVSGDRLALAVADVAAGHVAVSPALVRDLVATVRALRAVRQGVDPLGLTSRERDVVALLATGLTTKQVAQRLGVSPTTVRRHVSSAVHKLGARDRRAVIAGLRTVQDRERQ